MCYQTQNLLLLVNDRVAFHVVTMVREKKTFFAFLATIFTMRDLLSHTALKRKRKLSTQHGSCCFKWSF